MGRQRPGPAVVRRATPLFPWKDIVLHRTQTSCLTSLHLSEVKLTNLNLRYSGCHAMFVCFLKIINMLTRALKTV